MKSAGYSTIRFVFVNCVSLIACCLILSSCKKKDNFAIDYQYDYAPIDSGHYVIYDVDSIIYSFNDIQVNDTAHYQLMEQIGDTFYDNLNELNHELNLYRRTDQNSPWVFDRKWSVKRTASNFQKDEGNDRFVKLVFPPQQDEDWNGNVYLPVETDPYKDFLNWDYIYESVGVPFSVNNLNFSETLAVVEVNDSDAINKRLRKEVYAKGVGMIYQEWEALHVGSNVVFPNWQTGKVNGFRIRMKVREHN